jgi:hypothetical protein
MPQQGDEGDEKNRRGDLEQLIAKAAATEDSASDK